MRKYLKERMSEPKQQVTVSA